MLIHIVTEVDEREDSVSSGPVSAHVDQSIADRKAAELNDPVRGKVAEIGHYYQVFPITLDLTGLPQDARLDVLDALARTSVVAP